MQKIKKKLSSKALLALILAGVLVLLAVAYAIISGIDPAENPNGDQPVPITPIEGETADNHVYETSNYDAVYVGDVHIKAGQDDYHLTKSSPSDDYVLSYKNEEGVTVVYQPPVAEKDTAFTYSDLYSTVAYGEANVPTIYYLLTAVGNIYFSSRIPLKEDADARKNQLELYGFKSEVDAFEDSDNAFEYMYADKQYTIYQHRVCIGTGTISGDGFYIRVADYTDGAWVYRPYVYVTRNNTITYAMQPFAFFINPILVAKGLPSDGLYEPFYVTDFKEWQNKIIKEAGSPLDLNTLVAVTAKRMDTEANGGAYGTENKYSFDLAKYQSNPDYQRLIADLTGKTIGDLPAPISFTVKTETTNSKALDFSEQATRSLRYEIVSVDALLTASGEITAVGTPVGTENNVRVSYYVYKYETKNGVTDWYKQDGLLRAIIDLSDPRITKAAEIRALNVGEPLAEADHIFFDVDYTKDNADEHITEMVIKDILAVYTPYGLATNNITDNCYLNVNVNFVVDGTVVESVTGTLGMSELLFSDGISVYPFTAEERNLLIGLTDAHPNLKIHEEREYYEGFYDYVNFRITSVDYTVKENLVASFKYQNDTMRDPFYGETFYTNTLPETDPHSLYGVNADNCNAVTRILGGLGTDSSASLGLTGTRTVAVGLTASVMEEYGLYAYTVYYELPRGIYNVDQEADNMNIGWRSTLGFTLHVSELQPDGTRFVGCDMYDIVVAIDGSVFDFAEYSFTDHWARNNVIMTDITNITQFELNLNTAEIHGNYLFNLTHEQRTQPSGSDYTLTSVRVTPTDIGTADTLAAYLSSKGLTSVGLDEYFRNVAGLETYGKNFAGSGYFTSVITTTYFTNYMGTLTAAEQAQALLSDPIMTMTVTLKQTSYKYVLAFYRVTDRQVMVRMYRADGAGNQVGTAVSDFYITTYAAKRIINQWAMLLDCRPIDENSAYGD
ncbi:MAG: hypothetical protein MJ082_03690 [Clostridia bacterium]|nr:hypothetical protein [Clostridia bacterium]